MPTLSVDQIITIAAMLVNAGVIYGAIKSDLKSTHEKIDEIRGAAKDAHKRLDDHITMHLEKGL